jgi:hypothetical protein
MLQVNINKSVSSLKLCLEKASCKILPVDVFIAMDVSGSFHDEHVSGMTNSLLERLIPWGLVFDPDKQIDFYTFSGGDNVTRVKPVTIENYEGFIARDVIYRVGGYGGGTDYAPVIEKIVSDCGLLPKKAGFLSKIAGLKDKPASKKPIFLIFITDGENDDKRETHLLLSKLAGLDTAIYIQFIGVGNGSEQFLKKSFWFIEALGKEFKNTAFTPILSLSVFLNKSDDEINGLLISDELVSWFDKFNP